MNTSRWILSVALALVVAAATLVLAGSPPSATQSLGLAPFAARSEGCSGVGPVVATLAEIPSDLAGQATPQRAFAMTRRDIVIVRDRSELPAGSRVADLHTRPADPALQSCHYKLADRPAANPIVAAATRAIVQSRLVSATELADNGAIYLLADDPFQPGALWFTALIPSTGSSPGYQRIVVAVTTSAGAVGSPDFAHFGE